MNRTIRAALSAVVAAAFAFPVHAQVTVKDPWVRATVAQQKATGAFMQITSVQDARLVEAKSSVAGVVEIHEMAMEKDVMRMRALPKGLELPAGKPVELKSGGYHVMLMDLKAPLAKGSNVPVTLVFQDAKGAETQLPLQLPVASQAPGAAASGMGQGAAHGNKH